MGLPSAFALSLLFGVEKLGFMKLFAVSFDRLRFLALLAATYAVYWLVAEYKWPRLLVLLTSSLVFYAAEVAHNPKVNSVLDAFIYCSTCLSVGYGDIFAMTPIGKMVGTYLMTIGPALSGATLDGPKGEKVDDVVEKEILATLKPC